jgi:AAA family ATP:ADP antiporter
VYLREGEPLALLWSCAFFFLILSGYYVIRPIRDEMGVAAGVENLAYLFTGTLIGVLLIHPLYTSLVARLPRRRFVPYTYRFFIVNLIIFFFLFRSADATQSVWIARVFFIWVSVLNLFIVSVFWSFMTDIYRTSQSKRLFGVVAVGGTLGATLGSMITTSLVGLLGPINLLLVSAIFLEMAAQTSRILERHEGPLAVAALEDEREERVAGRSPQTEAGAAAERASERGKEVIGGGVFEGVHHVLRSPYLLGIAALVAMFAIVSTFLYFQVAAIVARVFEDDPVGRTRLFASRDLAVNVLTLGTQIFLTGRILRWLGISVALAFLPAVSLIGFGILAAAPVLAVAIGFEILRRSGNFAVQRPAREVLYTVLLRTDKYKAKNFNDTFVYRVGDQVGAWSYTAIGWLGIGLSGLAFTMVPVSAIWLLLAVWLGRKHRAIHHSQPVGVLPETVMETATGRIRESARPAKSPLT